MVDFIDSRNFVCEFDAIIEQGGRSVGHVKGQEAGSVRRVEDEKVSFGFFFVGEQKKGDELVFCAPVMVVDGHIEKSGGSGHILGELLEAFVGKMILVAGDHLWLCRFGAEARGEEVPEVGRVCGDLLGGERPFDAE